MSNPAACRSFGTNTPASYVQPQQTGSRPIAKRSLKCLHYTWMVYLRFDENTETKKIVLTSRIAEWNRRSGKCGRPHSNPCVGHAEGGSILLTFTTSLLTLVFYPEKHRTHHGYVHARDKRGGKRTNRYSLTRSPWLGYIGTPRLVTLLADPN